MRKLSTFDQSEDNGVLEPDKCGTYSVQGEGTRNIESEVDEKHSY